MNLTSRITTFLVLLSVSFQLNAQKISVSNSTVDCGESLLFMPVSAEFEIKNKGLRHLVITDIRTDCGCVKTEKPKKGLGPGEKFTLKLTYDGRMMGHYVKQAAIYTNAQQEPFFLKMTGVVVGELHDYSGIYPYDFSGLLTDVDQIEFDDVNKGDYPEKVIHIFNNTESDMMPNIMHLPPFLSAITTPEILAKKKEGKITLVLNSNKIRSYGLTQTTVNLASKLGDKVNGNNELPISVVLLPDMKSYNGVGKQYAPMIELSDTVLTFGKIDNKTVKSNTITLTNKGRTQLNISSIQMFTGGIKLTLGKRQLEAGELTKLKVTADILKLKKLRQKPRILMITNDPDNSKVIININVQ